MGVGGKRHAPAALPPGKTRYPLYKMLDEPPRTGLDGCGIPRLHRVSIPGPSSPWRDAIATELSRPTGRADSNAVLPQVRCDIHWDDLCEACSCSTALREFPYYHARLGNVGDAVAQSDLRM